MVAVVQLVRASDCGSECRGFESHLPPQKDTLQENLQGFFMHKKWFRPKNNFIVTSSLALPP